MTRTATSPRFATRTRLNSIERPAQRRLDLEQQLAELHRVAVRRMHLPHDAVELGLDLVHQFHRLEDAERLPGGDGRSLLDKGWRAGAGRSVERPDHRRLDAYDAIRGGFAGRLERCDDGGRR